MVADALSRKPTRLKILMESLPPELHEEMAQLNLIIVESIYTANLEVTPTLEEEVRKAQAKDSLLQSHVARAQAGKTQDFQVDNQGTLRFRRRICILESGVVRQRILK